MTAKDECGRVLAIVVEQIRATVVFRTTEWNNQAMVGVQATLNTIELASRQPV